MQELELGQEVTFRDLFGLADEQIGTVVAISQLAGTVAVRTDDADLPVWLDASQIVDNSCK